MFDREQFRDEIAEQLKYVSRDKQVAFAVRSTMRVLPLLAIRKNKEAFGFWKTEDKSKYLLAILRAYSYSISYVLTGKYGVEASETVKVFKTSGILEKKNTEKLEKC